METMQPSQRPRVVVIGGGFAGLWATRALKSAAVDIVLLDRSNHHLFQPLLYQVATAGLVAPAIAAPLRHILKNQRNVTTLQADVRQINAAEQSVAYCEPGAAEGTALTTLKFDYLLVASGATHAYFGHDDWAEFAPGLKTLDDALIIRRKVLKAFEDAERCADPQRRKSLMTFAIIGGGPTGVELAGTLAEIARHTLRHEFRRIDPREARVVLIEAGPRVLSSFDPKLSAKARSQLEKLGVEVWTDRPVSQIDANGVIAGEQVLAASTVLWAAGVAASPLGKLLGAPLDRAGRVMVLPDLSVPSHPRIFVAGDLAGLSVDGKQVPGVAPTAKQMGSHVAKNLRALLRGRTTANFRYRDYGALATIGRHAAVVDLKGWKFSGVLAWWFWLAAHIFFLIGFRNRLVVLSDWAWAYFTHQRWARIIVDKASSGT
jgi:NADH dehydrogenase